MRPLLVALADGTERSVAQLRDELAKSFGLTPADLEELIPSGRVKLFQNRVGWAITYLLRAELIARPKRATYRITDQGSWVLDTYPDQVDLSVLATFPKFQEFRQTKLSDSISEPSQPSSSNGIKAQTPEEQIENAYRELRTALAAELLDRILEQSAEFFEQLVLDLLISMGYGGSSSGSVRRLGRSGDEGVDGVIKEDQLGLDLIYVQAKRWANPVGRPEIQKFYGALHGKRATKGVFITTSSYSAEAKEYAAGVSPRVILMDGRELAQLMIDHRVGVSVARVYELNRIDLDYFTTEDDGSIGP